MNITKRHRVRGKVEGVKDTHVFGYTADERKRAEGFEDNNPALHVEWILIDAGITKEMCLHILAANGIALPAMYALGSATPIDRTRLRLRPICGTAACIRGS